MASAAATATATPRASPEALAKTRDRRSAYALSARVGNGRARCFGCFARAPFEFCFARTDAFEAPVSKVDASKAGRREARRRLGGDQSKRPSRRRRKVFGAAARVLRQRRAEALGARAGHRETSRTTDTRGSSMPASANLSSRRARIGGDHAEGRPSGRRPRRAVSRRGEAEPGLNVADSPPARTIADVTRRIDADRARASAALRLPRRVASSTSLGAAAAPAEAESPTRLRRKRRARAGGLRRHAPSLSRLLWRTSRRARPRRRRRRPARSWTSASRGTPRCVTSTGAALPTIFAASAS